MTWKEFLTDAYNLVETKKILKKKELDAFLLKYQCNENMLNMGYSFWKICFYNPNTTQEWWKTFFREIFIFVKELKGKTRKEILPYGNRICNKYHDNDITKLYYHIILEIEKK